MSNRYYFNKETRTCRGFHFTGCGNSLNNFMDLKECEDKCLNNESDQIRQLLEKSTINFDSNKIDLDQNASKIIRHQILNQETRLYLNAPNQWTNSNFCTGFEAFK